MRFTPPRLFRWCLPQRTDVLLTVQSNQKILYRQIDCQFAGKRKIPFTASDREKRHGRDIVWELWAREAPEHIKAHWPGSAWIVEVITDTLTRKGKRSVPTTPSWVRTRITTPTGSGSLWSPSCERSRCICCGARGTARSGRGSASSD
jgi:hypothetical protein